ncbi:class I SAM-dependent methyltransferase [Piscinibacter sp. HJYY11]|uniref:class I SAM-dependent methyltransferase n=1 Tax=Piscinibacter sp. HJYY11 TaxID=2801333 RepID=UPI00191EDFA9|nr:methyltransferase domain-containing protein [Piscinibacter sp. HJYY11]MBL0727601.1 methyltransferase domain-containing protein [Piscinibacter sp. HJYY11]
MSTVLQAPAPATFDAEKFKSTTRAQWQSAAEAWHRWGPFIGSWLGDATEAMFEMARVGQGCRVLDVAAGAGEQSLAAARRVGTGGHVLATDIAPALLERAERDAQAAGLGGIVAVRELDGEALTSLPAASFDAAISRVGLIYFPDQQRALAGMKHALKPGGRVAAIVYSTPDRNEFFSIPVKIIRERAKLAPPLPGQPGPFSLGGDGVLEAAFAKAGFKDIAVRRVPSPVKLPSAKECVRFERESFGALHQMMSALDEPQRAQVWHDIEVALSAFETKGGFVGPCEMLVGVGTV